MSKPPAFQFYPSDWQRDMDDYPLEIEGAWIRICCRLYWSGGSATKTLEEWARILRENKRKTQQIFDFFSSKNICDLVNQNGSITLTSRRIVRDEYIRKIRKLSGSQGGNPSLKREKNEEILDNQNDEQNLTPSSSSSSSSSKKNITPPFFDDFWKAYPKRNGNKVGKAKTKKLFASLPDGDKETIVLAAENYAKSKTAKDGYAKDPERFLKDDYWKDWIEAKKDEDKDFL